MMKLSKMEMAVISGVTIGGVGVVASAAYADYKDIKPSMIDDHRNHKQRTNVCKH